MGLAEQQEEERRVEYWRALLRRVLADTSTVDWYDISEGGIDNLALVAAKAVVKELSEAE